MTPDAPHPRTRLTWESSESELIATTEDNCAYTLRRNSATRRWNVRFDELLIGADLPDVQAARTAVLEHHSERLPR
jgi:hypothetical protein